MKSLKDIFPKASASFIKANEAVLTAIADDIADKPAQVSAKPRRGHMNLTEYQFERLLKTRFPDCPIRFEAYKLRIADRCYFCPDFAVIHLSGLIDFFECKGGHIWEDSKIKFKAAREMYPQHKWEMWQRTKGLWTQIL